MDLNEFRTTFLADVHYTQEDQEESGKEAFLEQYTRDLTDAEIIPDFTPVSFKSAGPKNAIIQVDGYAYDADDVDQCMNIIIGDFNDSAEIETLTRSDALKLFSRVETFVTASLSGFVEKNCEESSPGYGFASYLKNLCSKTGSENADRIKSFKFLLLTDRQMSDRITDIPSNEIAGIKTSFSIWDIGRLYRLNESKSGKEDLEIDLRQFVVQGIPCLQASKTDKYTAYLCCIPGKLLADLYITYGGRLLEGNVRSFLTAKGKVNSGIRRTIINDPAMFFAYNNGIATTAESIQTENIDGNEYITFVKDLQIVNGGQTTVSLANALTKDKKVANDLANIFVPMKLSVVSPEDAKKLIPDIAKYANRQNKVSDADLTSNHEFHRMFSDYAQTTPAPAKEGFQKETYWYYERAKGQYKQDIAQKKGLELTQFEKQHPRNQIITKTDLGKYANIWRKLPNVVVLGSDKNYKNFASWALPEDEDEWAKLKPQFDNADFFKRMVAIAILYKAVDKDVKNQSWYEMGYKAQTVVYALDKLLYQISSQFPGNDLDYMRIWDLQDVPAGVMKEISEIAEQVYHVLTAADRPIDNVTEWAKRSACWDRIKELPSSLPETFAQYVKKVNVSRPQKAPKPGFRKKPNEMEKLRASVDAGKATEKNPKLWESLYQWGQDEQAISPSDLNLVNRMRLRRVLSNGIEYFTLMEILKESRDRGFLG